MSDDSTSGIPLLADPLTIPETPAKVFNEWYLTDLVTQSREPGKGSLYIAARPYLASADRSTGELAPTGEYEVRCELFAEACAEVPEALAAFTAVVAALGPIIAWDKARKQAAIDAEAARLQAIEDAAEQQRQADAAATEAARVAAEQAAAEQQRLADQAAADLAAQQQQQQQSDPPPSSDPGAAPPSDGSDTGSSSDSPNP